jgi:hypothetical protein
MGKKKNNRKPNKKKSSEAKAIEPQKGSSYKWLTCTVVTAISLAIFFVSGDGNTPTEIILANKKTVKSQSPIINIGSQSNNKAIKPFRIDKNKKLPLVIEQGLKKFPVAWKNFFKQYSDLELIVELEECKSLEEAVIILTCHLNHDFRHEKLTSWLDKCEEDIRSFTWGGKRFNELSKEDRMAALGSYLIRDRGFKYSDDITNDMYNIAKVIESNQGYCATLPVIFTLVARRLQQPVHLVTTVNHVFCRFDDGETKINIESTSPHAMGVGTPDSFYIDMSKSIRYKNVFKLSKNIIENTSTMDSLNLRQSLSVLLLNSAAAQSDPKKLKSVGFREISSNKSERLKGLKYTSAAVYFDTRCVLPIVSLVQNIQKFPEDFNSTFVAGLRAYAVRKGIFLPSKEEIDILAKEVDFFKDIYEDFKGDLMVLNTTCMRFKLKRKAPNEHLIHLIDSLKLSGTRNSAQLHQFIKANSLLLSESVEKELITIKNNIINVTKKVNEIL